MMFTIYSYAILTIGLASALIWSTFQIPFFIAGFVFQGVSNAFNAGRDLYEG